VVVTLGAIVSVGAIAIWQTRLALASQNRVRAAVLAETASHLVEAGLIVDRAIGDPQNLARLPSLAALVARATEAFDLAIYDDRGRPLEPRAPASLPSDATAIDAAIAGAVPRAAERPDGLLVVYAPLRLGAARGAVRASFAPDAAIDALLARARDSVLLLGALDALVLLVVGSLMLRGTVVRPVQALEDAARRVGAGDLDARPALRGPGELGRLADGFEKMTASLRDGQQALVRSEKLAGVGRMAAGVAHEVGNPLAAILGYVETLLGETEARPIDPALRRDVLERVRAETERIHRIIQELLEYARPAADDAVEAVDVARVAAAAVSLVRAQARGQRARIDVDVPPLRARASAGRLTQVLVNLLLNAADATDGGGHIRVEAAAKDGRVVIAVEDDGPGVAPEHRARLFEPFFSTKDPGKGTGLGLSVSLAIVERWGGTVRLADRARGARFEVELPAAT
jgi:signal transduction histidine kinase